MSSLAYSGTHDRRPPTGRGVIAVLRTDSPKTALSLGRGFALTTLAGIEVTMTVPGAVQVIAMLVAEGVPRVGAGTVRTLAEVDACAEAGASFIVSPHLDPALVQRCVQLDVPACPGVMTPSEIVRAMDLGQQRSSSFRYPPSAGMSRSGRCWSRFLTHGSWCPARSPCPRLRPTSPPARGASASVAHYGLRRPTFLRSRQSGTTRSRHWTRAVARP
jgi:hypothetical protein